MLKGFHLSVMIGPAVPIPVSQAVLDSITSVSVTSNTEGPSVFQITFALDKRSPLHTLFLLTGGAAIPLVRVVLVAIVNGAAEVLMDGVMTNHQIGSGAGGQPVLTVIGEDLSRVMDYIDFSGTPFPAMPAEARVLLILAKYAVFGIVPMVIPSVMIDVPVPTDWIPRQEGKDLAYVRKLADDVGYVFYVDPGPKPGMSIGYWGPQIKIGPPQPALTVDMDVHTNVETLSFQYAAQTKKLPIVFIQEENSKVPLQIPIPDISPLNPPLGIIPAIPTDTAPIRGTAKLPPVRAVLLGIAKASQSADVVTGTGTLDVLRYGRLLKARRLVGVRGAGHAFDGLHFVKSVTHEIKRGEYKQNFTLSRNGLLSTVPQVPA